MLLKLAKEEDILTINSILNDPSVYTGATLGKDVGPLDIALNFDAVHVLVREDGLGCVILDPYNEYTMEVHTCLLPEARVKDTEQLVHETLCFAFADAAAVELVTRIPVSNKAADLFARQAGFIRISDGEDLRSYQLTVERWPCVDKALSELAPSEFRDLIPDKHFWQVAGAMSLIAKKGFLGHAVAFYNKHARLHGYPRMEVIGLDSILVGGLAIHFDEPDSCRVEGVCLM